MGGILSYDEAVNILRLDAAENYPQINILLPAIDEYIKKATGKVFHNNPVAKVVAQALLVQWFENPALIGSDSENVYGVTNLITQLQYCEGGTREPGETGKQDNNTKDTNGNGKRSKRT